VSIYIKRDTVIFFGGGEGFKGNKKNIPKMIDTIIGQMYATRKEKLR